MEIRDILEGLRCRECYPRAFGEMVDDSPENLYAYNALGGTTMCFCKKHVPCFNKDGAMKHLGDEGAFVAYGAEDLKRNLHNELLCKECFAVQEVLE